MTCIFFGDNDKNCLLYLASAQSYINYIYILKIKVMRNKYKGTIYQLLGKKYISISSIIRSFWLIIWDNSKITFKASFEF